MPKHPTSILVLFLSLATLSAAPALAQGEILITQAKANAGNVTPGDAAGFPVTLSLPGSYILASNLQPPANKAGIRIASDFVDIDMNGFRLNGAAGATTGIYGAAFKSATIRNGTISGFAAHGIYGTGEFWIVEDMRVVENGADGIHCGGGCLVEDSISSLNGADGIVADFASTVLGNLIIGNGGFGIQGVAGYGNNTLVENNGSGAQVDDAAQQMHPNVCAPACP
jgi:hypothetical protein